MAARDHGQHSVKPKIGILVHVDGLPGVWRILDKHPEHGRWWLQAADDAARAKGWSSDAHTSQFRRYRSAA